MRAALKAEGLSKWFGRGRLPTGPSSASNGTWALSEVSFNLPAGESLGLVGPNGAGKTTLLRLAAGVLSPSTGKIATGGRVTSVLELTAPFSAVLSGRENLKLALLLQGVPGDRLEQVQEDAAAFSGLGEKLDRPLSTYSQGMVLRLGFSAATAYVGELLLLDEVLLVGDEEFQIRCNRRILEVMERGASVVFASHDLYRVEHLCRRTLWLDHGRIRADGPSAGVIDAYQRSAGDRRDLPELAFGATSGWVHHSAAELPVKIHGLRLLDGRGVESREFATGGPLGIELEILSEGRVPELDLFFYLYRNDGLMISQSRCPVRSGSPGRWNVTGWCPALPFTTGEYSLNVAVIPKGLVVGFFNHETCRRIFSVNNSEGSPDHRAGVVTVPFEWNVVPAGGEGRRP